VEDMLKSLAEFTIPLPSSAASPSATSTAKSHVDKFNKYIQAL
jgi:hypothetical protein